MNAPVEEHGRLRVEDGALVDEAGNLVQLKGASSMWLAHVARLDRPARAQLDGVEARQLQRSFVLLHEQRARQRRWTTDQLQGHGPFVRERMRE